MTSRSLRTSALSSREELADALQALFVAELLKPSTPLWLVTPWISDIAVLDNSAGLFTGLLPDLPQRPIRLAEVLVNQMQRGGTVVIACRSDDHNKTFIDQLQVRVAREAGLAERLVCKYADELHEKGILFGSLHLSGSMNLTYNGIRRLEESILITDNTDSVSRARHSYEDRWGVA
ncbi:phospholipase D-like domain-containing protein [Rhodococcus pyridinivorans]|uniref:phospholipase D-like domain-containing protein DpdK n=1 Tax=Rhodococcus pyridinivorans TaxID=103816 RepID=UPI0020001C54|nr:phospholipase D-like domain-containing protein DpdK [Rhodococcus pyridinivorans]UPK63613.1 phospholipase D-like domain-containing protein [Rhodococcus pyridinivorans]